MMSQILYELQIECLPGAIPPSIKVDVVNLDLGHSLHVGDLKEMEGIRVLTGRDQTIVVVEAPKAEEVVAEAAPEEVMAEPEVISRRKEEEETEAEG
jgi:large subunit ribosomal protein L25